MKLAKATIYYYSHENDSPTQALEETLERKDWVNYEIFNVKEVEIGEWYDDIDLNNNNCTEEQYENYFTEGQKKITTVCNWVLELMEVSHLTDMTLDEAVERACVKYIEKSSKQGIVKVFMEGTVRLIKERCEKILEY